MEKTTHLNWYEWFLAGGVVMLFTALAIHHTINTRATINDKASIDFSLVSAAWIEVEIYGAVTKPGRFRLPKGSTLKDLFEQAVPLEGADLSKKKLKGILKGGQKIEVSFKNQNISETLTQRSL